MIDHRNPVLFCNMADDRRAHKWMRLGNFRNSNFSRIHFFQFDIILLLSLCDRHFSRGLASEFHTRDTRPFHQIIIMQISNSDIYFYKRRLPLSQCQFSDQEILDSGLAFLLSSLYQLLLLFPAVTLQIRFGRVLVLRSIIYELGKKFPLGRSNRQKLVHTLTKQRITKTRTLIRPEAW